jgi:hypothetical protein
MNEVMECSINTLKKFNIETPSGNLMSYLGSDEWVQIAEHGTK